jgi:hypothetical protein
MQDNTINVTKILAANIQLKETIQETWAYM